MGANEKLEAIFGPFRDLSQLPDADEGYTASANLDPQEWFDGAEARVNRWNGYLTSGIEMTPVADGSPEHAKWVEAFKALHIDNDK